MFKLLLCFLCVTLLLHVSTAYFYDSTTNEAAEIYQMRLQMDNVLDMEADESGCIESEIFPAGDSKSKFKVGVCPKRLNEETKLNEGFVLVLHSIGNTPTNMAYFVYDLYVLGNNHEQTGRYTVRTAVKPILCETEETCSESEMMIPESQLKSYLNTSGGIVIHLEILMLQKCDPCLNEPTQLDIKASKCSIDSPVLKTCVGTEPYIDFPKNNGKQCARVLPEMMEAKKSCEDVSVSSSECLSIKDIVLSIEEQFSTKVQRTIKSSESTMSEIIELQKKIAHAEYERFNKEPCARIGEEIDSLKRDLGDGEDKIRKHLKEVSGGINKFKDDYLKTEAARPKDPCYALKDDVNNLRTDFADGLSKSGEQMTSISSEITKFRKEYTEVEAAHSKAPCGGFPAEILTFNNKYADEVKKTESRLKEIEKEIEKFRNNINTMKPKDNVCDEIPEKIEIVEKSFSDKFNNANSGNEEVVEQVIAFIKEGHANLAKEITKFVEDEAAAKAIREEEKKLEEKKRQQFETKIQQLKDNIDIINDDLEEYKEECKGK